MATLMEKDALLNGASQCIAFLSNIIDNCQFRRIRIQAMLSD